MCVASIFLPEACLMHAVRLPMPSTVIPAGNH
jgi:hypothetical protein